MELKNLTEKLGKNKILIAIIALGVLLMLLPNVSKTKSQSDKAETFSVEAEEKRIAEALSEIEGAGKVRVVLTAGRGTETVIAYDKKSSEQVSGDESKTDASENAVITGSGSSETPVSLLEIYPEYTGALVIAEGADDAGCSRKLTEAIHSLTGLGRDKITVVKMK